MGARVSHSHTTADSDAMEASTTMIVLSDDRLFGRLPLKTADSVFVRGCQALLHRLTAAATEVLYVCTGRKYVKQRTKLCETTKFSRKILHVFKYQIIIFHS